MEIFDVDFADYIRRILSDLNRSSKIKRSFGIERRVCGFCLRSEHFYGKFEYKIGRKLILPVWIMGIFEITEMKTV